MNKNFIPIVKSALDGDTLAFEALYNMTKDAAYFVALNITQNRQDAEDILHNSYIKAFQGLSTLAKPETFDNWFNRIVSNNAKDYIKKKKPVLFADTSDFEGEWAEEEKNADYIPHQSVDNEETSRLIMEIINRLPEDQRLCILMYYYQEMSVAEIASVLDLTVSNVKYKLSAARNSIKKGVEDLEKNGTKLYAVFPFFLISTVLNTEAQNIAASGVVPTYTALSATTTAAAATKVSFFSTVAGKISVAALAVLIVGGTVLGITLATQNQPTLPVENSQVSQTSLPSNVDESQLSETSTVSEVEPSEDETAWLDWKFETVETPTFDKTEFTTIQVYEQPDVSVTLSTPSFAPDLNAVKERLRKNKILSDKYKFAEGQDEMIEYKEYSDLGLVRTYVLADILYCYTDELLEESKEKYIYGPPFSMDVYQHYKGYKAPEIYDIDFSAAGLTQDEIFAVMKDIFGEQIAKYLVYNTGTEIDEDHERLSVEIEAPDKKSMYRLSRSVRPGFSGTDNYDISFIVQFVSDVENDFEYYLDDNYKPIQLPVTLDEIFPNDMGTISLNAPNDPYTFFNKALSFSCNADCIYDHTSVSGSSCKYIVYEDGSTYCEWDIDGFTYMKDSGLPGKFELDLDVYKQADGTVQVTALDLWLPSVSAPEGTPTEKMVSSGAKQFAYIFDADEKEIEDMIKSDESKEIEVRLCGRKEKVGVVSDFSTNYNNYFLVSF